MLAGASLDAEEASSTKISVNSSNHSGRSWDRFPSAGSMSRFLFVFSVSVESYNKSHRARLRVLRLRVVAGLGVESSVVEFLLYRC